MITYYPHIFVASKNDPNKCAKCFEDGTAINPIGNSVMAHEEPPWDSICTSPVEPEQPESRVASLLTIRVEMECESCHAKTWRVFEDLYVGASFQFRRIPV